MKRALIYIRVSTTKQDMDGYSIPLQKSRLIAYCKAKGWVISGMFIDPGFSGATLDRPGMDALVEAVKDKKGDVVLVYKLDRLSRSQRDVLLVLEEILDPAGVAFVSMQESFDTSTIYGKAMLGILSVFAQMERDVISERTLMGRAGRAADGYWHGGGTDPIGYDYIDGMLEVNKSEAEQVRMVYGLYADGYSVTDISRRMSGYETKHGDWSHTTTVGNVLDNPLYAGTVHFDGQTGSGRHKAIVTRDIDRRVKARRERCRRAESAGDSNYLLTGVIYCAQCGARYFPNRRPNGTVVYSCHSRAKKNKKMIKDPGCKAPHIPLSDLDSMVEGDLLRLADEPDRASKIIKKRTSGDGGSFADKESEVARLDAEIGRLMDLYQRDDLVSVGDIADRIAQLHAERMRVQPKREEVSNGFDIEGFMLLLQDVRFSWFDQDLRGKRALLLQLIRGIHIDAEGVICIDWSV